MRSYLIVPLMARGRAIGALLLASFISNRYSPDQYEHAIEYVGFATSWDRLVFRGPPDSRKFLGFYLKNGIVRAAVGLNRGGDPDDPKADGELKTAVHVIRNGVAVDPAKLIDESVDLRRLVAAR